MAFKYIISIIFVITYILFGDELGFSSSSPLWTHFTYSFQHVSITHLVINMLVFITAFRVMEKFISWKVLYPVSYLFAVAASFFAEQSFPTVGASGMIYALFGMETVIVLFNRSTKKQKITFLSAILLMLVVSFFNTGSNFMVHLVSFTFGVVFFLIIRGYLHRRPLNKTKK